jgi:hypothetical protein
MLPKIKLSPGFKISSLKDLNIGPLLYLQEHYPLIVNILHTFDSKELPTDFEKECKSEIYLKIFVKEIDQIVIQEDKNVSSLPSVVGSIANLGHLRSLYTIKEVKEVTDIISKSFP